MGAGGGEGERERDRAVRFDLRWEVLKSCVIRDRRRWDKEREAGLPAEEL